MNKIWSVAKQVAKEQGLNVSQLLAGAEILRGNALADYEESATDEERAPKSRKLTRKQQAREARRQAAIACHNEHQKGERIK